MRLQITTASLPYYSLERALNLARRVGVESVELALTPRLLRAGADRAFTTAERHGVRIRSLLLPPPTSFPPERSSLTMVARFARELPHCEVFVLPPFPPATPLLARLGAIHSYREAFGSAARCFTIENAAPARDGEAGALDRFAQFRRVAEEWDLGFTYDLSAAAEQRWVITEPLGAMGKRLRNIHFSDFRALVAVHSSRAGRGQLLPTHGTLPLRAFLRALARREYGGLLTLDAHSSALRAWWPPVAKHRLAAAIAFCRTALSEGLPPAAPPLRSARIEERAEAENESI